MGTWRRKKRPLVTAPNTRPTIIQAIQRTIRAMLKKMYWKEWKRLILSRLKRSITTKRCPVKMPARYASAAAVFAVRPEAAAGDAIACGLAEHEGQKVAPSAKAAPHD